MPRKTALAHKMRMLSAVASEKRTEEVEKRTEEATYRVSRLWQRLSLLALLDTCLRDMRAVQDCEVYEMPMADEEEEATRRTANSSFTFDELFGDVPMHVMPEVEEDTTWMDNVDMEYVEHMWDGLSRGRYR